MRRLIPLHQAVQLIVMKSAGHRQEQTSNTGGDEAGITAFPSSLIEFQQRLPDEASCVGYLFKGRWPEGFVCLGCGTRRAWELHSKPWTWECAGCHRQTSVSRHHHAPFFPSCRRPPWFWATYLMATHSNGV